MNDIKKIDNHTNFSGIIYVALLDKISNLMAFINIISRYQEERLSRIEHKLDKLNSSEDVIDHLVRENIKLKQELKDALSGTTLPPAAQEKLNLIYAKLSLDTNKVKAILEKNKNKSL